MLESNAKQIELNCNGRGYLKKKKTPIKKNYTEEESIRFKDGDSWTTL